MFLKPTLVIFLMFCAGCGHLPDKPQVELGIIDHPNDQIVTAMTGGNRVSSVADISYQNFVAATAGPGAVRKPLATYNRAVCFLPEEWAKVQAYMDVLREVAEKSCGAR